MPKPSAFAPCGLFRLSASPPRAKTIYRDLVAKHTKAYDLTAGTDAEATLFAMAMGIARVEASLERAGNNLEPARASDTLLGHAVDYGVVPGANDTAAQIRQTVAARAKVAKGAGIYNVTDVLASLLGAKFIAYRVLTTAEATAYPTTWTAAGTKKANPLRGDGVPKFVKLAEPVTTLNVSVSVLYTNLDTTAGEVDLQVGDVVMVQAENTGLAERVTVDAVARYADGSRELTATFTKAHDVGATVTTRDHPHWWSTQRQAFVIVTAAAAIDPEVRRQIHDTMRRLARGVSTWAIVAPTGAGTIGGFSLNVTPLGTEPFGSFAYP